MNLSAFTEGQGLAASLQEKSKSMVIRFDGGSHGGEEEEGLEREIGLCEAADHVIGGENGWVPDGLVEGERVVKWD